MRNPFEEKIKKELRLWIEYQHPSWCVYPHSVTASTLTKGHPRQVYHFSPDIDVLAFSKIENVLIGYEVKAPIYRYKNYYCICDERGNIRGWQPYANRFIREPQESVRINKKEFKTKSDPKIIYTSIGEAFFNLRYVDFSFVVLPTLKKFCLDFQHPTFIDLLFKRLLPLGLIEFEYSFPSSTGPAPKISATELRIKAFKESYKAESSLKWKDYNMYMGQRENNFVWEKGGLVGTIRNHLIDVIKKCT